LRATGRRKKTTQSNASLPECHPANQPLIDAPRHQHWLQHRARCRHPSPQQQQELAPRCARGGCCAPGPSPQLLPQHHQRAAVQPHDAACIQCCVHRASIITIMPPTFKMAPRPCTLHAQHAITIVIQTSARTAGATPINKVHQHIHRERSAATCNSQSATASACYVFNAHLSN
jgi:hypothetical protein